MLKIIPTKELEAMAHSPLGASGSERWLHCTSSVLWTWDMHEDPSKFAAEGTFGHNISEYCRIENRPARDYIGHQETIDGFTFTCDAAFADAVQVFIDYVSQFPGEAFYELRVNYDDWVKYGFGTCDDIRLVPKKDGKFKLVVTDLKMGEGIQVYAKDNPQLMLYALGAIQELGMFYDIDEIQLNICQPRLDHLDEWTVPYDDLMAFGELAKQKGKIALSGEGEFVAGSWCTKNFCRGRHICKTRASQMADLLDAEMDDEEGIDEDTVVDPNTISNTLLGKLYSSIDFIRGVLNGIEERAGALVQAGEEVLGSDGLPLKYVSGRANRAYIDKEVAEKKLKGTRKIPKDVLYKTTLAGIPAMEKVLGKNHPFFELDGKKAIIHKPKGKPVLVLGSDPREPIKTVDDEIDELDNLDEENDKDFLN